MNLKVIILNERSHTKESTYCMVSFIETFGKCKVICSDIRQISGCRGTGALGDTVNKDYRNWTTKMAL